MIFKFRKKPVQVMACQYTGTVASQEEILSWTRDSKTPAFLEVSPARKTKLQLKIKTLEGDHLVTITDFVIQGIAGEFYSCKSGIFWATYERIYDGDPGS